MTEIPDNTKNIDKLKDFLCISHGCREGDNKAPSKCVYNFSCDWINKYLPIITSFFKEAIAIAEKQENERIVDILYEMSAEDTAIEIGYGDKESISRAISKKK